VDVKDFDAARTARAEKASGSRSVGSSSGSLRDCARRCSRRTRLGRDRPGELLEQMDAVVNVLSSDDERARWTQLRQRREDPLTTGDMRGLMSWLYEVEAQVPTIAPESSSHGRGRVRSSSGDATSSPAAAAS
jgi:hypothetical protein